MEEKEGSKMKIDKKSLMRLIVRLASEGHIKSVKTLIRFGDQEREVSWWYPSKHNALT